MIFKDEKNSVGYKSIFETVVEVNENKNAEKEAKKFEELDKKLIMVIVIIGSLIRVVIIILTLAIIWV